MITKRIRDHIHNCVLRTWKFDVSKEYCDSYIYNEATLVSDFYHYLRLRIGDLENIRIFTEYSINGYRADMIIAEVTKYKKGVDVGDIYFDDEDIIAIFEFKYKNKYGYKSIKEDFYKVKEYKSFPELKNCRCYVASILYNENEKKHFLDLRSKWARDVIQLNAFKEDDKMNFFVCDYKGAELK